MLGLEEGERLLTKEEIKDFITKLKRDEGEEVVTDMHISDRLEEEYGFVNSVAYREGLLIEEDDSDFVKSQVIHRLANVLGNTDIYTEGSVPLVEVSNPIENEFDHEKYQEPVEVGAGEQPLYRSDTNGFKDVGYVKVGYPVINVLPYNALYYAENDKLEELEDEYVVDVKISMLVEETMSLKDVYDIYNEMDVYIDGDRLDTTDYEFTESDLNNKYVLKDTVSIFRYKYDLTKLTDGENKLVKDAFYFDFDYENTPVIDINGVEFFTEIDPKLKLSYDSKKGLEVTEEMEKEAEDSKIYYKK